MELNDKITILFNHCGHQIYYKRKGFFLNPKRTYLCFNDESGVQELSLITLKRTDKLLHGEKTSVLLDDLLANPDAPQNARFMKAVDRLYTTHCEFRPKRA